MFQNWRNITCNKYMIYIFKMNFEYNFDNKSINNEKYTKLHIHMIGYFLRTVKFNLFASN